MFEFQICFLLSVLPSAIGFNFFSRDRSYQNQSFYCYFLHCQTRKWNKLVIKVRYFLLQLASRLRIYFLSPFFFGSNGEFRFANEPSVGADLRRNSWQFSSPCVRYLSLCIYIKVYLQMSPLIMFFAYKLEQLRTMLFSISLALMRIWNCFSLVGQCMFVCTISWSRLELRKVELFNSFSKEKRKEMVMRWPKYQL